LYFGTEANAPQIDKHEFVGSKEECEVEIIRLNLTWASEIESIYKLIHDGTHILSFSVDVDSSNVEGTTVVGTFQECQEEITRLGLTWPSPELVGEVEVTEEVSS